MSLRLEEQTVDLQDIKVQEVNSYMYAGTHFIDIVGADVEDILEAIGEDIVKKYFDIPEEEL